MGGRSRSRACAPTGRSSRRRPRSRASSWPSTAERAPSLSRCCATSARSRRCRRGGVADAGASAPCWTCRPVAIWIIENDHVAFANRAAFDLFGVAPGRPPARPVDLRAAAPRIARGAAHAALASPAGRGPPAVVPATSHGPTAASREVEIAVHRPARPRRHGRSDGHHRRHAAPAAGARAGPSPRGICAGSPPAWSRRARRSAGASRASCTTNSASA